MSHFDLNSAVPNNPKYFKPDTQANINKMSVSIDQSAKTDLDWSKVLTSAFRDPIKLLEFLELDTGYYLNKIQTDSQFKMLVPLSYATKMKKSD